MPRHPNPVGSEEIDEIFERKLVVTHKLWHVDELDGRKTAYVKISDYPTMTRDLLAWRDRAVAEAEDGGFREGQRVGQYQAADKLYHYVTHLFMFIESKDKKIKVRIPEWVGDMTKQCEKFLNHNRRVYYDYVRGDRYKRMHPKSRITKEEKEV